MPPPLPFDGMDDRPPYPGGAAAAVAPAAHADAPLVFDACHLGVVLRALLMVELLLALVSLYSTEQTGQWLLQLAWLTSGALPGTLMWLLLACSLKRLLQRLPGWQQYGCGIVLGVVCGWYASGMLVLTGYMGPGDHRLPALHWLANGLSGGMLAAVLVGWLVLRARGRVPAATTAQLALLQARIRPHFLFNALNSAIALVREDPARAEHLLHDLGDLFRAALQERRATIALAEEIELAQRYLDIEQARFGPRLQVRWELDPGALAVALPPLILQPLVENAVKHGVEASEEVTHVTICVQRVADGRVLVLVTNTLPPLSSAPGAWPPVLSVAPGAAVQRGQGMALENVRHRLRLLYDVQAEFSARRRAGVFEVRIVLPDG